MLGTTRESAIPLRMIRSCEGPIEPVFCLSATLKRSRSSFSSWRSPTNYEGEDGEMEFRCRDQQHNHTHAQRYLDHGGDLPRSRRNWRRHHGHTAGRMSEKTEAFALSPLSLCPHAAHTAAEEAQEVAQSLPTVLWLPQALRGPVCGFLNRANSSPRSTRCVALMT